MKDFTFAWQRRLGIGALVTACTLLVACATPQAVVYPSGGKGQQARALQTLAQCEQLAATDVGRNHREAVAQRSLTAGASDTAEEVASGWIKGSSELWREGLAGGVGGIAGALVKSLIERDKPDRVYEKYVEACMKERGHQVLGWR